ncbi:reverse transcriptase domain-containing protein [Tanacetum coccineum]
MYLKRQIEEMLKAGKLSHLIKELKQNNRKDQAKVAKKGEAAGKDKPLAILMVQTERKIAKQRVTQTFSSETMISFPPLGPGVRRIKAIPSTAHEMLKFPVTGGTVTLRSSRIIPLECTMISGPKTQQPVVDQGTEEKVQVAIHPEYPEQTIAIGSTLTEEGRKKLCGLLRQNLDIFTWKPADMTGVPRHITEHRLNVCEGCFPVRQKKRGQASERNKALYEEMEKLVNTGIMKEVQCHSWLSNPVMVKKHDNSWRMCVDFKDLNKACPKDGYPLPEIDWKVESLCGYHFKCFLDAYKGYHQIKMAKEDEEKTAFIISQGIFCYSKMSFGLKNAGATYQRLVDKAFQKQIGRNLEAYVDDLVIKRCTEQEVIRDVEETFRTLRMINMKLNPKKCTFRMKEGVFLGRVKTKRKISKSQQVLIVGLKIAEQMGGENLQENVDSRLVANQVNRTYVAKETDMIRYLEKVKTLTSSFKAFSIKQVPRNENKKADALTEVLAVVEEEGDTWMTPIFKYLSDGTLPAEGKKVRAVKRKSWRMHAGTRSVVAKALQIGYYWPAMHEDARKLIQACQDCQVHKPVPRNPQQKLSPITSLWPFYKWDIDIVGPFPEGPGKVKFLIVAIDYFTKWIEAKPVATIIGSQIKKFVWDNIVCRFGLPGEIISDNGKQFQDNPFKDWCEKLCIRQHFASVKHPQTNGLVERANRSLGEGIKARLDERSKNWMEELPHVLWAHRTMIKSSNGDTPFSLTYGTEAVIPAEIGMPTLRTAEINLEENKEALEINLDLLEERREQAAIREAKSKAKMERYYNSKVRSVSFKPGDLVYRNNEASRAEDTGKLGPKWEGPYEVTEALGKGAYKLRDRDGNQLPRTWNVSNLKKCYVHKM